MSNPYLNQLMNCKYGTYSTSRFLLRRKLCKEFSFAVPSDLAIQEINKHSNGRVIEIGAGTGYWAWQLRQGGVDVVAYDKSPKHNRYRFKKRYFKIKRGGPKKARKHSDRALFLCWPCYNSSFAADCLRNYAGDTLIYIGEGYGGCTADDRFYNMLDESWTYIEDVGIPQWDGIHDILKIYKR